MEIVTRQAALCIFWRNATLLVAEIIDPHTGVLLHRPPGGGIEDGETPEQAVRRELHEELGITLTQIQGLGAIDHTRYWKGREVQERAWIFLANSCDDPRLKDGQTPEIREADGERHKTVWRAIDDASDALPALCPSNLIDLLRGASRAGHLIRR